MDQSLKLVGKSWISSSSPNAGASNIPWAETRYYPHWVSSPRSRRLSDHLIRLKICTLGPLALSAVGCPKRQARSTNQPSGRSPCLLVRPCCRRNSSNVLTCRRTPGAQMATYFGTDPSCFFHRSTRAGRARLRFKLWSSNENARVQLVLLFARMDEILIHYALITMGLGYGGRWHNFW